MLKRLDVTVQSFGWSDRAKVPSHVHLHPFMPPPSPQNPDTSRPYKNSCSSAGGNWASPSPGELGRRAEPVPPFLQTRAEQLARVYQPLRSALASRSGISVAHLLAARQDFSKILRTSSGKIREKTACAINKVGETSPAQGRGHVSEGDPRVQFSSEASGDRGPCLVLLCP